MELEKKSFLKSPMSMMVDFQKSTMKMAMVVGWLVEPNYSIIGVDGWAGWKTEATAYLEFTKMGHENKI